MPLLPPSLGLLTGLRPLRARRAAAAIVAALGGFAAVSFAVAPLSSDPTPPAQRQVLENLVIDARSASLQAWRDESLQLHQVGLTRAGDTVAALLRRLSVTDADAAAVLSGNDELRKALAGARNHVRAVTDGQGELRELVLSYPASQEGQQAGMMQRLSLTAAADGSWASALQTLPLTVETASAVLKIQSHLAAAASEAGLPERLLMQLQELCSEQLESECGLGKGDSVSFTYERLLIDGEPVPWLDGVGRVLAARFVSGRNVRQLVWFVGPEGRGAYFDGRGRGREPGFTRAPLEYTQITSGFATRLDPFLRREVAHQGIDFSAPIGTPVQSVAPGVVEFAGRQSGYGNVVEVRHSRERSTLYAHLSRIDVAAGDTVQAGQLLGAVGRTGWATGPHLHFEYRIGGLHHDPRLASQPAEVALLTPAARAALDRSTRLARIELDRATLMAARPRGFE